MGGPRDYKEINEDFNKESGKVNTESPTTVMMSELIDSINNRTESRNLQDYKEVSNKYYTILGQGYSYAVHYALGDGMDPDEYWKKLQPQVKTLLNGPDSVDDKDVVIEWMIQTAFVSAMFKNDAFCSVVKDKEFHQAKKDTAEMLSAIKDWEFLYIDKADFIFENSGKERNLDSKARLAMDDVYKVKKKDIQEKLLDCKIKGMMVPDRKMFLEIAGDLENAKSKFSNSKEYTQIVNMLKGFGENGVDFSKAGGQSAEDWKNMNANQRVALPLFMLHDKIESYLSHKAKDGVNVNAYGKLVAMEKLNQYIAGRIEELNPGTMVFRYDGKNHIYNNSDVHKTYESERQAEIAAELKAGHKGLLFDTSSDEVEYYHKLFLKNNIPADKQDMQAASDCMDRIMLKVQKNHIAEIENPSGTQANSTVAQKILKSFTGVRTEFLKNPPAIEKAAENKLEGPGL